MHNPRIRPLVICVFRHRDRILVEKAYDPAADEVFYRPLGGGIEFGEHSRDALVREIREEIGTAITGLRLLGTLENIFTYDGRPGHEIVQVYDGVFVDRELYDREHIGGFEHDANATFRAYWLPLEHFRNGLPPLYPDGLYELLTAKDIREP